MTKGRVLLFCPRRGAGQAPASATAPEAAEPQSPFGTAKSRPALSPHQIDHRREMLTYLKRKAGHRTGPRKQAG